MLAVHDVRQRLVEAPDSLGARYRRRRWDLLLATFPDLAQMSVLDLGGTAEFWLRAPVHPASVQIVNLAVDDSCAPPAWLRVVQGDACDLDSETFDRSFDVTFSNSVIEHVGGHRRREQFAAAVRAAAPRYWVQTPYRYFPVEPHWLFPGFQFLPVAARVQVSRRWPLLHTPSSDPVGALRTVLGVELLGLAELRHYFPDASVLTDRVGPLIKSVIAVRR